jgi:hypothetical protein
VQPLWLCGALANESIYHGDAEATEVTTEKSIPMGQKPTRRGS